MVPYDQLLPIEQAIVAWKIAHPILSDAIIIALGIIGIAGAIYFYKQDRKIEHERMKRERAEKRAWIKSQGGL